MAERSYHVTARSFPIVYTVDGDHDRNGLLYTLRSYGPLLDWARGHWDADDEWLPEAHRRKQRVQMLIDALWRYERMRDRLRSGSPRWRHLLDYRGTADLEDEDAGRARDDAEPGRAVSEVEQNLRATVDEIAVLLDDLTGGEIDRLALDPAVRAAWAARWRAALAVLDAAVEHRLELIARSWDKERERLAQRCGLTVARAERLIFNDHSPQADRRAGYDRFHPLKPIPLVRPLVLRARRGETVEVRLENQVRGRRVGLHREGSGLGGADGDGVRYGDGAEVGRNPDTTVAPGDSRVYVWHATDEGVWALGDLADIRGTQAGTNLHGLFGAFVVEPEGARWRDPETGADVTDTEHADGPDVDVIAAGENVDDPRHVDFVDFHLDDVPRSFREFTVFFHDEPEVHGALHVGGEEHAAMPISYRAEPMLGRVPHRMRRLAEATPESAPPGQAGNDLHAVEVEIDENLAEVFWIGRRPDGSFIERVSGEEQHHSSWLFGDPATPVLRAYRGDPTRIRLVHAGVKETHVFHLHVHQWHAAPAATSAPSVWRPGEPRGSQLVDSISIGPQAAVTVDPLYGAGSRQRAPGDIIWHCHLYPHFHEGMWGLVRSFDRLVDGTRPYPDGTPCHPLVPLPGRTPPAPDRRHPGFPWFVDAAFPQKSPPPPAIREQDVGGRRRLLGLPAASRLERAAFDPGVLARPRPGALFVDLDRLAADWNAAAGLPPPRVISYVLHVRTERIVYNSLGWHDEHGHFYEVTDVHVTEPRGAPVRQPLPAAGREPLFIRANHGDVVEFRLHNDLGTVPADGFDLTQLPVECGLHVHLVKFDVLAADGSSTGWNYLSGASSPEAVGGEGGNVSVHRWVVDEEFGPCFFHDHLLANYRQKRGLFGALQAQPPGSTWTRPRVPASVAWFGAEAVVDPRPGGSGVTPYREACIAVGDFVPLHDRDDRPLNAPGLLGGDDDPGAMAVNYRCSPLTARGPDPSQWFATARRRRDLAPDPPPGVDDEAGLASWQSDPDTPVFETHPGERLRMRLIQGSHEEQHSLAVHGLRWRRDWHQPCSVLTNQQTIGISEAFTLDIAAPGEAPYGVGDHLWRFSGMDDLWLGCWGLVRALPAAGVHLDRLPALPGAIPAARPLSRPVPRGDGGWSEPVREYVVRARRIEHRYHGDRLTDPWGLVYELAAGTAPALEPDGDEPPDRWRVTVRPEVTRQPLVLRVRRGEWLRITLVNEIVLPRRDDVEPPEGWVSSHFEEPFLPRFGPEPDPPLLPLDEDTRTVSNRVSLHPALLRYDVVSDDGAYVGHNHDGTIPPLPLDADHGHGRGDAEEQSGEVVVRDDHNHGTGNWREYWWYADGGLAPASHTEGIGHVCYLHDMADIRNHRHHGLIGAVIVEPGDVTPVDPDTGRERWSGTHALLHADGRPVANEQVLFWQDGLRHYLDGNPQAPVPDVEPGGDPEDSGQKGINYRSATVHARAGLTANRPPTPIWPARTGETLWLRLVGAADKPRNHTFTLHGHDWDLTPPPAPRGSAGVHRAGSLSGLTADTTHDITLHARHPGDHAYRSGAFRWAVQQGLWGILRVDD